GRANAHTLPSPPPPAPSCPPSKSRPWSPSLVGLDRFPAFAAHGPDVFARAPVRAVHVAGRVGVTGLARCPHIARLTRLECSFTRLDADDVERLGGSEHAANLAELAFAQDGIDADGLRALVESPLFGRLTSLELRENVIVAELLVDALGAAGGPGNLRKLSLAACRLTRHDAANLFALPVLRDLDHLDLSDNALHADGVAALAESNITRGLRTL